MLTGCSSTCGNLCDFEGLDGLGGHFDPRACPADGKTQKLAVSGSVYNALLGKVNLATEVLELNEIPESSRTCTSASAPKADIQRIKNCSSEPIELSLLSLRK